jgi:predicted DNA-binding protein
LSDPIATTPEVFELTNKFKNLTGMHLTRQLFYETTNSDKSTVLFTLKDKDHHGFPSLYRLYMETNDPTEWRFATTYLDNWSHWETLCACAWFKDYLYRWRKELELRLKSENLARLMALASSSSREASTASKYLIEKGWEPREPFSGKGRPSKQQVKEQAFQIAQNKLKIDDDFKRISKAF